MFEVSFIELSEAFAARTAIFDNFKLQFLTWIHSKNSLCKIGQLTNISGISSTVCLAYHLEV